MYFNFDKYICNTDPLYEVEGYSMKGIIIDVQLLELVNFQALCVGVIKIRVIWFLTMKSHLTEAESFFPYYDVSTRYVTPRILTVISAVGLVMKLYWCYICLQDLYIRG